MHLSRLLLVISRLLRDDLWCLLATIIGLLVVDLSGRQKPSLRNLGPRICTLWLECDSLDLIYCELVVLLDC